MKYSIRIPNAFDDMTIKTLLEEELLIPRKIRHFLRTKKHVSLNGQIVHWQDLVKTGDLLELTFDEEDYPPKTIPMGDPHLVQVLYQDEHILIANKPEGMKTHANQPNEIALLNHVSAHVGETCYVVHRLDKETSGAILFAKNPFILPILNRLLEDKKISREYMALCQGRFPKEEEVFRDKIGRHRHDRRKRVVDLRQGQEAETRVLLQETYRQTSLVTCQLKTGRTHQIRVHLAHHGHAIIGDPLYSLVPSSRLMLHAHTLTFEHPFSLKTIRVSAPSASFEKNRKHYL